MYSMLAALKVLLEIEAELTQRHSHTSFMHASTLLNLLAQTVSTYEHLSKAKLSIVMWQFLRVWLLDSMKMILHKVLCCSFSIQHVPNDSGFCRFMYIMQICGTAVQLKI